MDQSADQLTFPAARILIVEDDPHLRIVIRMVLEKDGYEVCEAPNGSDALTVMATNAVTVVVADLRMPVMTGAELVMRVRSDPAISHTPIVLMSGYADQPAYGADAWLRKPFEATELSAVVASLIKLSKPGRDVGAG